MDFELSDDQLALRDAARDLLDGYAGPDKVRAHVASGAGFDATLWKAMVEQGWPGIELPETDQGLGLGFVEACVLLEQSGRHVAPAPFAPTLLALWATRGTDWTGRLLDGAIGTVAWSTGGEAALVPYAPVADMAIVGSPGGLVLHDLT